MNNKDEFNYNVIAYIEMSLPYIGSFRSDGLQVLIVAIKTELGWKCYESITPIESNFEPPNNLTIQRVCAWGLKLTKHRAIFYFPELDPEHYNI